MLAQYAAATTRCKARRRRPARPAAEHVPGLRLAARRPAHAPHATILSGSACCVYGLTFTSHFYGARRSVGYVPFNSETLVTGKLFEDIREAVYKLADPAQYDSIVVINLCVPTATGVPLQLLPKAINGVRIIGIDVPGFGVPTHAEAKDVLAGAMLRYARNEAEAGPVAAPRGGARDEAHRHAARRDVPGRSGRHRHDARADGPGRRPGRCRRASGASCTPRSTAPWSPRSIPSTPPACASSRPPAAASSVRRPWATTAPPPGCKAIGRACNVPQARIDAAKNKCCPPSRAHWRRRRSRAASPSGYEGSELLVARLLVESGADVRYVGTACPKTPWSAPDLEWLEARGVHVQYRASLEQDLAAVREFKPDLAIGTTPVVQAAKQATMPALYFTNLISARPLMGPIGAGSLAQVINAAIANKARFDTMHEFFGDVGEGDKAGVWEDMPTERPEFRAETRRQVSKPMKKRKAEEMM